MATLTKPQAAAAVTLTEAFKAKQNRDAAKIAAAIALYYQTRVNVEDPSSIEEWLDLLIPRLVASSDSGAHSASAYFSAIRRLEAPRAGSFTPTAATGAIDEGVRKSLLTVGPYAYVNKARQIEGLALPEQQRVAMLAEAKQVTSKAIASSAIRHAQAGGRQTIHDAVQQDRVALGYVRVTRAKPCYFCAMLASRGLTYRAFKKDSFELSNARFTGDGNAKVHDNCGCSLKPVFTTNDPLVERTEKWADMWSRWGAGGGDAALRFRRGYDHWARTGEFLDWDIVNEGLRG